MITLRPHQSEAHDAVLDHLRKGGRNALVSMSVGCHAPGTRVLKYSGEPINVEDVRVGDFLLGPDGRPREVLATMSGEQRMFEIEAVRHGSFVVNEDHVLHLEETNNHQRPGGRAIDVVLRQFNTWPQYLRNNHYLVMPGAVEFAPRHKPNVDPWVIGALLGDGSLKYGLALTSMDKEIIVKFSRAVSDIGCGISVNRKTGSKAATYKVTEPKVRRGRGARLTNSLQRYLIASGLFPCSCDQKFIPDDIKFGSLAVRRSCLAGLVDTDGHMHNGSIDIVTKSRRLADDIVFVGRSLGFRSGGVKHKTVRATKDNKGGLYWRVALSGCADTLPCVLPRKKAAIRLQKKSHKRIGFSSRCIGVGKYYGFELSGDKLYLTDDFIIHHNSGKSLVQAAIAKTVLETWPGTQILGLTLNKELIAQNTDEMVRYWSNAPVGMNCSGLKRRDVSHPLIYGHPLSVRSQIKALGRRHILMIDEVHNVSRNQEATVYGKMIADLRASVPDLVVLGFTGTEWRLDSGRLDEPWRGKPSMWDKVVYRYTITDGIRDGYLVPPIARRPGVLIDVTGVGTRGGEFIDSQLQQVMTTDNLIERIADDILRNTAGLKRGPVFCCGVADARAMRDALAARGASAVVALGDDEKERDKAIAYYKAGNAKYLVNVGVATTGFNDPESDFACLARPTQSSGLLVQMVGRVIRSFPGKTCGYVFDYAGNFERLGCIDQIDGKKYAGPGGGKPPTKLCPDCQTILPASKLLCACGHEWEKAGPDLAARAIDAPILAAHAHSEWKDVSTVHYALHQKRDYFGVPVGKPSLCITYICGVQTYNEYWAFESDKPGGRFLARQRWMSRSTGGIEPETAVEAVQFADQLRKPGRIQVKRNGKYWEVLSVDMSIPPKMDRDIFGQQTLTNV